MRRVVLQNAHAEFQSGQITAILGKSGSGKSTLLNLISGIDEPDSGQIWVDRQELTALLTRPHALSTRPHRLCLPILQPDLTLTVGENVAHTLEFVVRAWDVQQKAGCARSCRPSRPLENISEKLSGGEQQRAALKRALVHDPSDPGR